MWVISLMHYSSNCNVILLVHNKRDPRLQMRYHIQSLTSTTHVKNAIPPPPLKKKKNGREQKKFDCPLPQWSIRSNFFSTRLPF